MRSFSRPKKAGLLGLASACEFFERVITPSNPDALEDCVEAFSDLANNKAELVSSVAAWLKLSANDQSSQHVPNSFIVFSHENFFLRINTWPTLRYETEFLNERTGALYSYGLPHNHNVDFLSCVIHGPGYLTDLYTWKNVDSSLRPGDVVELVTEGQKHVHPGTVVHYESLRDIHIQRIPEKFSVTLNLIVRSKKSRRTPQFIFDVEHHLIHSIPSFTTEGAQISLLQLSCERKDPGVHEAVDSIARSPAVSDCVREAAAVLLAGAEPLSLGDVPRAKVG